jgi:hypothetical protein
MSLSNTTENAALKMFLQGTDPSYRSGATEYLALFTADPGEAASLAAEADYTGYARVPLTKASAWTDNGSTFNNAALVQFGACTLGSNTITHFAVVDTGPARATGVNMMISGQLSSPLNVSPGIQPQFATGDLSVSAD